mgnify:CR=1 FL=1
MLRLIADYGWAQSIAASEPHVLADFGAPNLVQKRSGIISQISCVASHRQRARACAKLNEYRFRAAMVCASTQGLSVALSNRFANEETAMKDLSPTDMDTAKTAEMRVLTLAELDQIAGGFPDLGEAAHWLARKLGLDGALDALGDAWDWLSSVDSSGWQGVPGPQRPL